MCSLSNIQKMYLPERLPWLPRRDDGLVQLVDDDASRRTVVWLSASFRCPASPPVGPPTLILHGVRESLGASRLPWVLPRRRGPSPHADVASALGEMNPH
jgi:hypothetical protein